MLAKSTEFHTFESVGDLHIILSGDNKILHLDALAVNDLDVDIFA
jgi:hypothetical protein